MEIEKEVGVSEIYDFFDVFVCGRFVCLFVEFFRFFFFYFFPPENNFDFFFLESKRKDFVLLRMHSLSFSMKYTF